MSYRMSLAIILLAAMLTGGARPVVADEGILDQFLNEVQVGDVEGLLGLMHPKLAERIDKPILECWMQAVSYRLGQVEAVFPVTDITTDDRQEMQSTVSFTKGTARVSLTVLNNYIVSFEVQSDQMTNWFQRPLSLKMYRDRAEEFLSAMKTGDYENCLTLLHEQVASQLEAETLEGYHQKVQQTIGQQTEVAFKQAKLTILEDERLEQIDLFYELKGEMGTITAEFAIRFQGMQGQIVGFRFR